MGTRIELQQKLQELIGSRSDGKQNVFFQPPEGTKLVYPCIRYKRSSSDIKYASDRSYSSTRQYEILVIDKDPDSDLPDRMIDAFPMIRHNNNYVSDNLIHDSFNLYF